MAIPSKPNREPDFKMVDYWGRTIMLWWEEEILQVEHEDGECFNPISICCDFWHWYARFSDEWVPLRETFGEQELKKIKEAHAEWLIEKGFGL